VILGLLAPWALRSLALGAVVWLILKVLRVRHPQVQMTAWTVVLIASLAMPALTGWVRLTLPADALPSALLAPIADNANRLWDAALSDPVVEPPAARRPPPVESMLVWTSVATDWQAVDWLALASGLYAVVAGALLLRLSTGVVLTCRLVRAARPIRESWTAGWDVRASDIIGMPVAFGSTILLPAEWHEWSVVKRRAVLAHEGSHVARGDSYVLLMAAFHRALFWFNPFAWWLVGRLSALAEIISDDAALEAVADRSSYVGILLDVAQTLHRAPAGVAMARPRTVGQRAQRVMTTSERPAEIGWRRRLAISAAFTPAVAVCAATFAIVSPSTGREPAGGEPVAAADPANGSSAALASGAAGQAVDSSDGRSADPPRPRMAIDGPLPVPALHGSRQPTRGAAFAIMRQGEQLFVHLAGRPYLALLVDPDQTAADGDVAAPIPLPSRRSVVDLRGLRTPPGTRERLNGSAEPGAVKILCPTRGTCRTYDAGCRLRNIGPFVEAVICDPDATPAPRARDRRETAKDQNRRYEMSSPEMRSHAPTCSDANFISCTARLTRVGSEPRYAGPRCAYDCFVVSQNIRSQNVR
jgi:beta-lactamase regulating signal transducer with metallopeptidase domain